MSRKRFIAKIHGRVQGVGFRFFAREAADELGVVGYVRNMPDGGVEVLAEGDESRLAEFLRLLGEGPISARVARVDVSWEPPTDSYDGFFVKA